MYSYIHVCMHACRHVYIHVCKCKIQRERIHNAKPKLLCTFPTHTQSTLLPSLGFGEVSKGFHSFPAPFSFPFSQSFISLEEELVSICSRAGSRGLSLGLRLRAPDADEAPNHSSFEPQSDLLLSSLFSPFLFYSIHLLISSLFCSRHLLICCLLFYSIHYIQLFILFYLSFEPQSDRSLLFFYVLFHSFTYFIIIFFWSFTNLHIILFYQFTYILILFCYFNYFIFLFYPFTYLHIILFNSFIHLLIISFYSFTNLLMCDGGRCFFIHVVCLLNLCFYRCEIFFVSADSVPNQGKDSRSTNCSLVKDKVSLLRSYLR